MIEALDALKVLQPVRPASKLPLVRICAEAGEIVRPSRARQAKKFFLFIGGLFQGSMDTDVVKNKEKAGSAQN